MALTCRTVRLGKEARGLVVRPRPGGGPDQTLVFTQEGDIHELEAAGDDGENGGGYRLGPRLGSTGCAGVCHPVYDPASQALTTRALCAWVADGGRIRRLDVRSRAVTMLAGAEAPPGYFWWGLAVHPTDDNNLWAATGKTVCRVRTEGNDAQRRMEVVAGDWKERGSVDGNGPAARFGIIRALLPVSGGRLLIADGPDLRCMDAGGAVSTLLRGCLIRDSVRHMALLPSGELAAVSCDGSELVLITGGDFAPSSLPSTAGSDRLLSLLEPQAEAYGAGDSDGRGTSSLPWSVTVRVGDRAFHAHRSVLVAGSEYFARLLAPGGGFAESGGAEVSLPDADPATFAHLLSYMYSTAMGVPCSPSQLLAMPPELLRPTAALAGRLLMGGAVAALTERLAAAATPASVLSDLAWADAHGMTELAERLRAFAVRKRKAVELDGLEEFTERCPQQAAKLLRASLQA